MSHGHNALFRNNFADYLDKVLIDNISWFRTLPSITPQNVMDGTKGGLFDLVGSGIKRAQLQIATGPIQGDVAIGAYWCPQTTAYNPAGWVDLPKHNPAHMFMFTPAMEGCALVVTDSPVANHYRVFHHQHPDHGISLTPDTHNSHLTTGIGSFAGNMNKLRGTMDIWANIRGQGTILSILEYADYGVEGANGNTTNAFNFLAYRNATWMYVTQGQTLANVVDSSGAARSVEVSRRPVQGRNGISIRSVC